MSVPAHPYLYRRNGISCLHPTRQGDPPLRAAAASPASTGNGKRHRRSGDEPSAPAVEIGRPVAHQVAADVRTGPTARRPPRSGCPRRAPAPPRRPRADGRSARPPVSARERKPYGTAAMPRSLTSFEMVAASAPCRERSGTPAPRRPSRSQATAKPLRRRISTARPHRGIRCARFAFIRPPRNRPHHGIGWSSSRNGAFPASPVRRGGTRAPASTGPPIPAGRPGACR